MENEMRSRIWLWSISSALAGFLFGFDTVVLSGAETAVQVLWHLNPGTHGVVVASALYGTVLGAVFGGWPVDRFGRRSTLLVIGLLYLAGALWSAFSTNVLSFIAARALGGVGIGMSTVAVPLYITEIAPPEQRGRLTGLFQFNIVFGIVLAYASNAMLSDIPVDAWRWMLGVAAIPALIYTLLCTALPESPRWLLSRRGDRAGAARVLKLMQPSLSDKDIEGQAVRMQDAAGQMHGRGVFWTARLRKPIMLAITIAFFNQMSGINAILYFAPRIFELSGLASKAALLQSIGIGLTNLVFTLVGLWLIDRLGRRTLLFIGSYGYIISLSAVSAAFFSGHLAAVPVFIFLFIAAHAVGQGVTIWVYISEIFPNRYRADGQALGGSTHWIFAALLTTLFPQAVTLVAPGYVFLFFAFMMCLQLLWVKVSVVETKGVPLETIAQRLDAS